VAGSLYNWYLEVYAHKMNGTDDTNRQCADVLRSNDEITDIDVSMLCYAVVRSCLVAYIAKLHYYD